MYGPAGEVDIKRLRRRIDQALQYRRLWDRLLLDIYDYVIPYRNCGLHVGPAQPLTDKLFDSTAPRGAVRFAGRVQQFLLPPFQDFFKLEAGPALLRSMDADAKKQLDEQLQSIAEQTHAALNTSLFHTASHEMFFDYFAGTGAMLLLEGDDTRPVRCLSVPIPEIAIEMGPWGEVWARYWVRAWPAWQIEEMWPNGMFSEQMRDEMRKEQDKPIIICQATCWDPKTRRWRLTVLRHAGAMAATTNTGPATAAGATTVAATAGSGFSEDEPPIWKEAFRWSPWITPRFYVVPGEPYGRGPAHMALANVKSLNKAKEFDLKAAALALLGVWAQRDDGVFNPDTARIEPGAMWTVGSTGGPLGPTLQKLDIPGKYDLSRFIIEEEREQVKLAMLDRSLPPEAGPVRSPTEIMERLKDAGEELVGVLGRMALEIVEPVAQRTIEILENKKILETKLTIDQLTIGLRVVSPIVQAAMAAYAKSIVDFAQIIVGIFGPQMLPVMLRTEKVVPDLGRMLGVKERYLRSEAEQQQVQQRIEQQAAAQMAMEMAKKAPPAAEVNPNGAGAV